MKMAGNSIFYLLDLLPYRSRHSPIANTQSTSTINITSLHEIPLPMNLTAPPQQLRSSAADEYPLLVIRRWQGYSSDVISLPQLSPILTVQYGIAPVPTFISRCRPRQKVVAHHHIIRSPVQYNTIVAKYVILRGKRIHQLH